MYREVSPISEIRVEIKTKSGHLFWAKKNPLIGEEIDIQALFNDYWNSDKYEFTIARRSSSAVARAHLTEICRGRSRWKG